MTQQQLIIKHLTNFGSITHIEAISSYGITRLAARISELKKDGYKFTTEIIKSKNRYGKTVHFAKYKLKGE